MTPAVYDAKKRQLVALAETVAELELDALLDTLARTRSASHLLPPEQYKVWLDYEPELLVVERLARALKPFREEVFRQLRTQVSA